MTPPVAKATMTRQHSATFFARDNATFLATFMVIWLNGYMVIWLCYFSLDLRKANRDWFGDVCKHCVMTPSSKTFVKENFKNFHEFSRYIGSTSLRPWLNSFLDIEKTWRNWNFQCNRRHVRRSSGWVLLREMQRSLLFGKCQVRLW